MEDLLPFYLSIGVTKDVFMNSCPVDLRPYEKAYKLNQERENMMMYLQGIYMRDAFASACNEKNKYPDKPYPIFGNMEKGTNSEANEMLAAAEWAGYAHALRRQGLQETEIKF